MNEDRLGADVRALPCSKADCFAFAARSAAFRLASIVTFHRSANARRRGESGEASRLARDGLMLSNVATMVDAARIVK